MLQSLLAAFLIWLAGFFAYGIGLNLNLSATSISWQTVQEAVRLLVRTWLLAGITAVLAVVAACPPLVCLYQCRNDRIVS